MLSLQFRHRKPVQWGSATDGEKALAEISRAVPDLVLLDVMMPKIDGFSICQQIRANLNGRTCASSCSLPGDVEREKGLALGADDYITKPFSTKDAIARVEAVLGRARKADGQ